ncbi:MAG: hypothetical protein WCP96_08525 [Methylococcaceae bacterium]
MQQLTLFDLLQDLKPTLELAELFEAYQACRSSKRNTRNALAFEVDYETHLVNLCADINSGESLFLSKDFPCFQRGNPQKYRDQLDCYASPSRPGHSFATQQGDGSHALQ